MKVRPDQKVVVMRDWPYGFRLRATRFGGTSRRDKWRDKSARQARRKRG